MSLRFHTFAERPDLERRKEPLLEAWPEFMLHDPVANACWGSLYESFPEFQHFLLDEAEDELLAEVNSVPVALELAELPDRGVDETLERATTASGAATLVCAVQVMIRPDRQGRGLSRPCLERMGETALAHGFRDLVAPVRPSWKARYPLIEMVRYVEWQTDEKLPFDPWLRVHARLGASLVRVCPASMTIPGSVAAWEAWTGMPFPDSGRYVVPGACAPVEIDREADRGVYVEPNVWMHHRL